MKKTCFAIVLMILMIVPAAASAQADLLEVLRCFVQT